MFPLLIDKCWHLSIIVRDKTGKRLSYLTYKQYPLIISFISLIIHDFYSLLSPFFFGNLKHFIKKIQNKMGLNKVNENINIIIKRIRHKSFENSQKLGYNINL